MGTKAENTPNRWTGMFIVDYDVERELFVAKAEGTDGVFRKAIVSYYLLELLQKCREEGLERFGGLTEAAIVEIHQWYYRDRVVLDYVAELWGEKPSPSEKGPIGYHLPREPSR